MLFSFQVCQIFHLENDPSHPVKSQMTHRRDKTMPSGCFHCLFFTGKRSFYNWDATGSSIIITLAETLACVAGVKKGKGKGAIWAHEGERKAPYAFSCAQIPPSPFHACHAGYSNTHRRDR